MSAAQPSDLPVRLSKPVRLDTQGQHAPAMALLDELQMIAWEHASALRVAFAELREQGQMWVLGRIYLELPDDLDVDRPLTLTTWPVGMDSRAAFREFALAADGEIIARATSSWSVLDRMTRQPANIPDVLDGHLPPTLDPPVLRYPSRVIPKLKAAEGGVDVTVTDDDIDINGHVNNLRYLGWALASLPEEWQRTRRLAAIDIQFRVECFAGDSLRAEWGSLADDHLLHALSKLDSGREVARLTTRWRSK